MKSGKRKKQILLGILAGGIAAVICLLAGIWFLVSRKPEKTPPAQLLTAYFQCLEQKDYEGMYRQLSMTSREAISEEEFIQRNQKIYEGIEAGQFRLEVDEENIQGEQKVEVPYTLTMETLAGTITCTWRAVYVEEEESYALNWSHPMIFPNLGEDDKVDITRDEAQRGNIYDRNGVLLAGEQLASSVGLVPGKMQEDSAQDMETLAQLLGMSVETIQKKLEASWVTEETFVPVKTIERVDELELKKENPSEEMVQLQNLQNQLLTIPGVMISDTEVRGYPLKKAAAHLIGYVQPITAEELEEHAGEGYSTASRIGKSGLEKLYEEQLRGTNGWKISILNKDGEEKEILAVKTRVDGKDLTLTIDAHLQKMIYEQFAKDQSTTAAINPKTGEVLALLSTPAYDDNAFVRGMTQGEWDEINSDETMPLQNRFKAAWCPGSSMKPLIAAIGLTTGKLDAEEDLGQEGLSWQKDESWGDYYVTTLHEYQGAQMENALIYSDNIYFAKAALKIGGDTLAEQLEGLGFKEELSFDFGLTPSGYSNEEGFASEIQLADSGYGQGQMLVNPLHMASMYSAIYNKGNMIAPFLVLEDGQNPSFWKEGVFTPEAASQVENMMVQIIENENGTGYGGRIEGVTLAGKTGTAELKMSKEDTEGTELGWFNVYTVGEENPILFVSMVEDVKGRGGSGYVVDKIHQVMTDYLLPR
ncbi:MAG: penicillin-binding transpeptidase domain-containing protein [Clostridiales bacterium]|nr:penicillin-binding transpeptidase domain-containing protein [Clostridiales bacterium]